MFQCSSASRKFLNYSEYRAWSSFERVSVLFSEPKIPQHQFQPFICLSSLVSVLFSEPKIPQCAEHAVRGERRRGFQCSSASRKFLNHQACTRVRASLAVSVLFSEPKIPQFHKFSSLDEAADAFQCSSASRKFLNVIVSIVVINRSQLQRAENSSIVR